MKPKEPPGVRSDKRFPNGSSGKSSEFLALRDFAALNVIESADGHHLVVFLYG